MPRAICDYGLNASAGRRNPDQRTIPCGVHLNDITVIAPVYQTTRLLGYVASLAHHVDVGGGARPASAPSARSTRRGIIPPVRLVTRRPDRHDIFRLILAQIRSKHETAGDLRAQIAANATGARRLARSSRASAETVDGTSTN